MPKKPDTFDRVQAQVEELRALLGDISSQLIGRPSNTDDARGEGGETDRVIDLRDRSERDHRIVDLRERKRGRA